jgi:hypothetical protein
MGIPNTQWTYVIVLAGDGEVRGTDDEKTATEFALNDENYVINTKTCQILTAEVDVDEDEDGNEISETHSNLENIVEQDTYNL